MEMEIDEWAWPVPAKKRPQLELQLLPPAPTAHEESPWGVDPSCLQQLMMGTSALSSATPSPDLVALFVDDCAGSLQRPLPSGWERCLDLQSGEVFLKRSYDGAARVLRRPCEEQGKDEKGRLQETVTHVDVERRQDWLFNRLQHDIVQRGAAIKKRGASFKHEVDRDTPALLDFEPDLCLDLNLRLTNGKRSKSSINSQDARRSRAANCVVNNMDSSLHGALGLPSNGEKPSNIQEMVKESTMVTAVCSKCLMYILLRKSKPVCPRCSIPIILEGTSTCSVSRKRPLVEFSSGDLSLFTDLKS